MKDEVEDAARLESIAGRSVGIEPGDEIAEIKKQIRFATEVDPKFRAPR